MENKVSIQYIGVESPLLSKIDFITRKKNTTEQMLLQDSSHEEPIFEKEIINPYHGTILELYTTLSKNCYIR